MNSILSKFNIVNQLIVNLKRNRLENYLENQTGKEGKEQFMIHLVYNLSIHLFIMFKLVCIF